MFGLTEQQYKLFKFWLPAMTNGFLLWLVFLILGDTPLVRATGLALVIAGVTLSLRRMGTALCMAGGWTLALSPVFWSQTGGNAGNPATIVIALGAASLVVFFIGFISKRPAIGFGIGIIVFIAFFASQVGSPRSLRLTGFIIAWLMFLLIDMLLLTNPRPDDAPPIMHSQSAKKTMVGEIARPYHTLGILLLLGVGILNDPLLTLLAPAIALSLFLTRTPLSKTYWIIIAVITIFGARGILTDYIQAQSYRMMLESWRDAIRWIDMVQLVIAQFGVFGIILGVLGLARLSRWYPPLGTVTLIAYGAYGFFGLVYIGPDRNKLLLPLFVIQVLWMTYAVLALSDWTAKSLPQRSGLARFAVITIYSTLPLTMLLNILQTT